MAKSIGEFIQELRKEKHYTQKELADKIGISDKTISKWENGNSLPDTSMLKSLCEALDISVNELLSGERVSPEEYSKKAEENIMTLIKENEQQKKSNFVSRIIGAVLIIASVLLALISIQGIHMTVVNYIDLPTIIIMSLALVGVVLISRARTKNEILALIGRTVMPIGAVIAIVAFIELLCVFSEIGVELFALNFAVVILSILYAAIIKVIVEILRTK